MAPELIHAGVLHDLDRFDAVAHAEPACNGRARHEVVGPVAQRLLATGATVIGVDNLNAYYDPRLKEARLGELARHSNFRFEKVDPS